MPVSMELPHPRFNAQLTVQDDVLYIYGGTFEKGDREFTFDDLYAIDLGKMDGCKEIFSRKSEEDWVDSDDEDDDEDDEYDTEDEEDEEEDVEIAEEEHAKSTSSKRKKKQDEVSNAGTESTESTAASSTAAASAEDEESEADTAATSVDDGLPHPRPFESRRDFFQRTSAEWQEVLITSLLWKGIKPESLAVKEIKAKAFELSEEKWWDSREEITALEDEQEANGIGEVVSLADRGETGTGGGAGGAGRRR